MLKIEFLGFFKQKKNKRIFKNDLNPTNILKESSESIHTIFLKLKPTKTSTFSFL